jgi:hypothetical protein
MIYNKDRGKYKKGITVKEENHVSGNDIPGNSVLLALPSSSSQSIPERKERDSARYLTSSDDDVKYPEIVNDPVFDLDEAERRLMKAEEPEGFLEWFFNLLFGHNESKIERIQRITKELEARHQLREQIIKLTAQKYRVEEALIEAQYSVVLKQLAAEAEAQRLKALKAVYEAEEGKAKRALKRAESTPALTEGRNEHDYGIESFFDLIEEDALNYQKSKR